MNSIIEYIHRACQRYPFRVAVQQDAQKLCYEQVWEMACGIAAVIRDEESPWVAVKVKRCVEVIPALLACWIAGKGYVPLHPDYPPERVNFILQDCGAQTIIDPLGRVIVREGSSVSWEDLRAEEMEGVPVSLESPAYLLFTSGSTGKPKGVPIYHAQLATFIDAMLRHQPVPLSAEDRFLQMFEFTFDLSVFSAFFPLCLGASTFLLPNEGITAFNVIQVLDEQRITVALMVPSVLHYLQPYFEEIDLPGLRYNLFCGEPLKWRVLKEWKRCVPNAYIENVYGPTEATIFCSYYPITEHTEADCWNDIVPIGKALPHTTLYLMDEELVIAGGQVTRGYWNEPLKTQEVFFYKDGAFHYKTGDICSLNGRQDFVYVGRKDFQVKIEGYRVELSEIEKVAYDFLGAESTAVAVQEAQHVYLFLFVRKGTDKELLMQHLKRYLPPYMLPRKIIELEQFPVNLSGKLDRKAMMEIAKQYV